MREYKSILIISQVYIPDPTAAGQYLADVANSMIGRGCKVYVLTADRGYNDARVKYCKREVITGVSVRRLPFSSFGKSSILLRMIAGSFFVLQCIVFGLYKNDYDCILVSTSPPIAPIAALVIKKIKRIRFKYWLLDLNPDQMIALGKISDRSVYAFIFNTLNRFVLRNADDIITLDEFMARRINNKLDVSDKLAVIPPWPLQDHLEEIEHSSNPFRRKHKLEGKFIIMYSGNHSRVNPLDTLLSAALSLQDLPNVVFAFIGGGVGKNRIDKLLQEEKIENIVSLPYQPLSELKYTLSAADIHVVSLGNEMVGILHPSKIYSAMAVGRPIIFIGPVPSYGSEIIERYQIGWQVMHGDLEGMIEKIKFIVSIPSEELSQIGNKSKMITQNVYNRNKLINEFCSIIEKGKSI